MGKVFSLHYRLQTGFGAHPTSYPVLIGSNFPGAKRLGHEAHHLFLATSVQECVDLYMHSPCQLLEVVSDEANKSLYFYLV